MGNPLVLAEAAANFACRGAGGGNDGGIATGSHRPQVPVVDGDIARARNLVTDFGKIVDPIADKAMTGAAFVMLSVWDYVPWWMTILILVREFGITIMRFTILKYGALPANMAGKAKTMMQSIAITFCLLPFELWWSPARWIGLALVTIAFVLTIWSGLVNLKDGLRLRLQWPGEPARRDPPRPGAVPLRRAPVGARACRRGHARAGAGGYRWRRRWPPGHS